MKENQTKKKSTKHFVKLELFSKFKVRGGQALKAIEFSILLVLGYETNCYACKEEMEAMIDEAQSLFTQEVFLDTAFHPRLIGQKGRNLKKVSGK